MNETTKETLVAVTGATGFTGGAVADRLLREGYRVRSLVRRPDHAHAAHRNYEQVTGALTDRAALEALVKDAEIVMNIAAMFRTEGPRQEFFDINHLGTVRLLEAARAAGVRRFVHCSTTGVHGDVASSPADEDAPLNPRDAYQESKLLGEQACRDAIADSAMEIVILRPCAIYGPGDTRMLKLFRMLSRGVFVMIGDGSANFHPVYIDDLVDAFMQAATVPDAAGETFIIGGPRYLPLTEYVDRAAAALGVPAPRIHMPYRLLETVAAACETICRPLGISPPLHRRRLSFFKHNRAFSIDKARHVLGYEPRVDLDEGFRRTVADYRSENLLPAAAKPRSRSA